MPVGCHGKVPEHIILYNTTYNITYNMKIHCVYHIIANLVAMARSLNICRSNNKTI